MMTRLKATVAVFGTAIRNRSLLRLELALSACGAEWGVWVSLVVYAYTRRRATASGAIAVVQLVPSVLRVLSVGYLLQAVTTGAVALAIAVDAPTHGRGLLPGPLAYLTVAVPRPAQAALLPWVVRSPIELTAATLVSGWVVSGSALVAPAATGVLIALGGRALRRGKTVSRRGPRACHGARLWRERRVPGPPNDSPSTVAVRIAPCGEKGADQQEKEMAPATEFQSVPPLERRDDCSRKRQAASI